MRTASGKLISSKPVSLSKAAKILSGFAGHENGASDAVSVYLKRAADAFNRLVGFHKELKNPHPFRTNRTSHVNIRENTDAGKFEIVESKETQKNPNFEVKLDLIFGGKDEKYLKNKRKGQKDNKRKGQKDRKETIMIERIPDEVGERMEEKKHGEQEAKIEEAMDIEQVTPDQVGEKRKKKKHKKEKVKNEEPKKGRKVLDEGGKGKKSKQENAGIEQHADEIEEGSVNKREKKKRKKRDGEEAGESVELEERKIRYVDGGETIDMAEQSGKKNRKRRKTEGED